MYISVYIYIITHIALWTCAAAVHWSTKGRMHRHFEPMPAGLSQKLCWSLHWLHSTKSWCCTPGSLWHFIKQSFLSLAVLVLTSQSVCRASRPKLYDRGVQPKLRCCWNSLTDHLLAVFSGIGYATQIVIAYAAVSYIVIQAWAFFYLFSSFTAEVPWASCRNSWNTGAWGNERFNLYRPSWEDLSLTLF